MTDTFTARQRRLSLLAINACVLGVGIAFGALVPLITLRLAHQGIDASIIGLNAAMFPLAVLVVGPFLPGVIARLGAIRAIYLGLGAGAVCVLLFPVLPNLPAWFALRFIAGAATSIPWVVSETWFNIVATEGDRGRIMGIYAAVLSGGFAIGPMIIGFVGIDGSLPFLIVVFAIVAAAAPLFFAGRVAPRMPERHDGPLSATIRAQPLVMMAALCGGLMDFALFALLPVYGLKHGLGQQSAVAMLSVFIGGNMLLQFPIGWLADRGSMRGMLFACGVLALAGGILLPIAVGNAGLFYPLVFLWGGALFAIYTLGLGLLGDGFPRAQLAAANVVFVMVYEIGAAGGPSLAGTAIDHLGPEGLPAVIAIAAALLLLAMVFLRRR